MRFRQELYILALLLLLLCPSNQASSVEIAPEASVKIVKKGSAEPEWKVAWDIARELANNGNYQAAVDEYQKVLQLKPNIEEVKWELCKALIEIGSYEKSSLLLEDLLELNSRRVIYLVTAGRVAMLMGNPGQATIFYGQALEVDPEGKLAYEAQKGFVEGLIAQDKRVLALPLMEQLLVKGEPSSEMIRNTAIVAFETGDVEKSAYYYRQLIEKYRVGPEVLLEASSIYEKIRDFNGAVKLWEQYIELYPSSSEFLIKAAEFYLQQRNYEAALPHIVKLVELEVNRERYLLEAGWIYLYIKGRADKALSYYEQYRKEFPNGVNVLDKISDIQMILANDFLSIVENDGVWILWRDLAKVTPDRIGIYRAMAELLKQLKRKSEYMEVLQIINLHQPDDFAIAIELARLYRNENNYGKCLSILRPFADRIEDPKSYYLLKADCEKSTGDDNALLETFVAYLRVFPDDQPIRLKAAEIAGDLGKIKVLEKLTEKTIKTAQKSGKEDALVFAYIDGLIKNRHLEKAAMVLDALTESEQCCSGTWLRLTGKRALVFKLQNQAYELEQLLRQRYVGAPDNIEAVLDLAENSLDTGDISSLRIWLSLAQKKIALRDNSIELQESKSRVNYLGFRFDELKGKHEKSETDAEEYLLERKKNKCIVSADLNILKYLALKKYRQGKYREVKVLLESHRGNFGGNREYQSIVDMVDERLKPEGQKMIFNDIGAVELFDISETFRLAGDKDQAEKTLNLISLRTDDQNRVKALLAELHIENARYTDALNLYEDLIETFPNEGFFEKMLLESDYLAGRIESFLARMKENADEQFSEVPVTEIGKSILSPEIRRQLARVLWLKGNWQDALQVYSDLELVLQSKVSDSVKRLKNEYGPQVESLSGDAFSEYFFQDDQHDNAILGSMLSPAFFSSVNQDTKLVQELAEIYSSYRWLENVTQEHEAKKALNSKRFYKAQKEYEELIEDKTYGTDVYSDLATIYSRLGRYTKETEMIEKIKEIEYVYPGMKTTVEKNDRERQPKIYYEGSYLSEDGREGLKDLEKSYNGIGLRVQPTIFQQFGLDAGWNSYSSDGDNENVDSFGLKGSYSIFFNDFLEAGGTFGLEDMNTTDDSYLSYNIYAKGTLEESVAVHVGVIQELVNDNMEALSEGIYRRRYGAGLTVDPIPSLFMGFDFDVLNYSDSNDGKIFNVWTSYKFFTDTSSFDFSYRFKKIENDLENGEIVSGESDETTSLLSYWSPGNYWRHMFSFEYRRELWPSGKLYSGTSWVSAMYGIGYESYESVVHMFEANIFLEIHPMFLLKGTLILDRTDGYDRNEGFLSLSYRW